MELRTTSWRCLTSVKTTTRVRSGKITTRPILKKLDGAWDQGPEMDPTRRLAGGPASHLLLT